MFLVGSAPQLEKRGNPSLVLPEVLRELYLGRRTGLLHVARGEDRVSFRFVNGEVVSGSSTSERGRLGETMVRNGLLAKDDLERALVVVDEKRRRLGPVLKEMGVIDQSRMEQALALHIREMLLTALVWDEAALLFEDQEPPDGPSEDLMLRCSTGELVLQVVRSLSSPETVRKGLGDIDRVLVAAPNPPFRFDRITLTPADGYVLSRVDGAASARDVMAITPLPVEDVERSLLGLLCTGVVEYRPGPAHSRRPAVEKRTNEKSSLTDPRRSGPKAVPPSSRRQAEATAAAATELERTIERAYESLSTKNHFQVLGLLRTASRADVKDAYARLVKTFDPDTHHHLQADLRSKLLAVFPRISEAHEVLSVPEKRGPYEQSLKEAARSVSHPAPPSSPASAVAGSEAATAAAPADTPSVLEALTDAEGLLAEGRCGEAVALLESIVPLAQGVLERRVRLLLGRGYVMKPEWARKAEGEFLTLIRIDPRDVEAHCALGTFYRDRSLPERARAMFEKALALQPGHRTAQAELAALRPPEPESTTLFGRLLHKAR